MFFDNFCQGFLTLMGIFIVIFASFQSYLLVVCSAVDDAVAVLAPNGADQSTIIPPFYCSVS